MVPPPHPHPRRQQKSPARGKTNSRKHTLLMTSDGFYAKKVKILCQGNLKRDPRENYTRRFPEVVQKEGIQQ